MDAKIKLIDSLSTSIFHGNVLRVRGKYPYEQYVDFMLFETQAEDTPHGLIVTSGYKAGLILVYLPIESSSPKGGVDRKWMVNNWNKWVYPDCNISDVYLIDGYEAEPLT
jgi:hypothetical protein